MATITITARVTGTVTDRASDRDRGLRFRLGVVCGAVCLLMGDTAHAGPGRGALSPRYTITIPSAGATRVAVRCALEVEAPSLEIGWLRRAAPGLEPTVEAYRIAPVWRAASAGARLRRAQMIPGDETGATRFRIGDAGARKKLGSIQIDYELDLYHALGDARDGDGFARRYQDRVVVTDRFATLRGDVLCVPLDVAVEDVRVEVVAPQGWRTVINADRVGSAFVFRGRHPAEGAVDAQRWFGLCGRDLVTEVRADRGLRWSLTVAPGAQTARAIGRTVWSCVEHYTRTFGSAYLGYLSRPPPEGIGRGGVHLFAVPFPAKVEDARGGQLLAGAAYFFYAPAYAESLGHVVAHEYLHLYNGRALHRGAGDPWFREAYTDVQATLVDVGLTEANAQTRRQRLAVAIVEAWAAAVGRESEDVLVQVGLIPASAKAVRGAAAVGVASDYDREIARGKVAMFGLAIALEKARPGRGGMDAWLRALLRDHTRGVRIDRAGVRRTYLEVAGADPASADLYTRLIDREEDVSLAQLRGWIAEGAMVTLCPRLGGVGAR